MSIDMFVSASKKQAASVSAMSKKQVQDYEDVQKAISEFTLNSPFLTGKAYDSAKQYFSLVLYPLGQAGILLSEAVERAVKRLPEDYQDQVDSGDLKQSELEEKIRQVNQLLGQAEDIRELIQSVTTPDILKNSQLQANMRLLTLYSDVKRSLEEKLDQLLRFNAYSETIFSEVDALQQLIEQGLAQTKTAWNGESKTFTVDRSKMDWALTVNEQWTSRENEINGIDEEKIKELEEYEIYAKLVYDGKGNPQVFWQLVKEGKGVKNPALYQYLKQAGHHLDPDMFEFISLDEWDKKVKAGFRDGLNLETGDSYSGFLGGLVSSSQVVEDMHMWATEAELAQALQVLGFSYASYRLAVGSGSKKIVNNIPDSTLKHADLGEFNSNNRLINGGHGQNNIEYLKTSNIEFNIVKEYSNGVRVGNIPSHKNKMKRSGTGQSWFPESWKKEKISDAGNYINDLPINKDLPDGQWIFGEYEGVRVGIIKKNGKPSTIIPDNSRQPK